MLTVLTFCLLRVLIIFLPPGTVQLKLSCQDNNKNDKSSDSKTTSVQVVEPVTKSSTFKQESTSPYWETPEYTTFGNESGAEDPLVSTNDRFKWLSMFYFIIIAWNLHTCRRVSNTKH